MSVITIYQLRHKFVNRPEDIPEDARQVVYYALAVGHHVGVMDCFSPMVEIPLNDYRAWVEHLPEGEARRKLEGAWTWGEIEVNCSHVEMLTEALEDKDVALGPWAAQMAEGLRCMQMEPAYYWMVRESD